MRVVGKFDVFGERSALLAVPRTAEVRSRTATTCLCIPSDVFVKCVSAACRERIVARIAAQDSHTTVSLGALRGVKLLGSGAFGDVFLVRDSRSKVCYALKAISRHTIARFNLGEKLNREREIMSQLDHPMIERLYGYLEDATKAYFLLEFIPGIDLFTAIREIGLLSESDALFYISCLILILEYLHERDILHRDLKPENVMLDDLGYPKLIDFGNAKLTPERTYTITGTPHYMAPEVILGAGYGPPADYWSLGILLHELMYGGVPFAEGSKDPYEVYEAILTQGVAVPPGEKESGVWRMVEQLLSRTQCERLGGNVETLKRHPWLRYVQWEELQNKSFVAPFVPTPQGIEETSISFNI